MIRRPTLLLLTLVHVSAGVLAGSAVARAALPRESIDAAHLLVLGRLPDAAEVDRAVASDARDLAGLVGELGSRLAREPVLRTEVNGRASRDAFGATANDAGWTDTASGPFGYTDQLARQLEHLRANPEAYRAVVARAYRHVVQRTPYAIEYDYWAARDPLPFFLLCACIENWAVRNQPGLMSTTGTPSVAINSRQITALRVSPALADDVRLILGRPLRADDALAIARRQLILAPGAAAVESIGGIHVVAAGADTRP